MPEKTHQSSRRAAASLLLAFSWGQEPGHESFCSGCLECRQAVEVDLIGREPIQAGVWTNGVIKLQVLGDRSSCHLDRFVGVQIDLLVLDRLPDSLAEDV